MDEEDYVTLPSLVGVCDENVDLDVATLALASLKGMYDKIKEHEGERSLFRLSFETIAIYMLVRSMCTYQ